MFTVERNVGRLVEVRVESLRSSSDAEAFIRAIRGAIVEAAPARIVVCADHRAVPIYTQAVSDRLVELFTSINQGIDRAGLIVARTNATFSLQIERIVRESQNPLRRVFYDPDTVTAWLSEVLTEPEVARMRAFLSRPHAVGRNGAV